MSGMIAWLVGGIVDPFVRPDGWRIIMDALGYLPPFWLPLQEVGSRPLLNHHLFLV